LNVGPHLVVWMLCGSIVHEYGRPRYPRARSTEFLPKRGSSVIVLQLYGSTSTFTMLITVEVSLYGGGGGGGGASNSLRNRQKLPGYTTFLNKTTQLRETFLKEISCIHARCMYNRNKDCIPFTVKAIKETEPIKCNYV
jgi:hypothetical protein